MVIVYGEVKGVEHISQQWIEVADSQLGTPMNELVHQPGLTSHPSMLYLVDEPDNDWDKAIKSGLVKADLYCMKTETNQTWPLGQLLAELEMEQAWFDKRAELERLILNPDKERLANDSLYRQILVRAYAVYEQEESPIELIEGAIEAIYKLAGK